MDFSGFSSLSAPTLHFTRPSDLTPNPLAITSNGYHEIYIFETSEDLTQPWNKLACCTIPNLENTDAIRIRCVHQYKPATVLFVSEYINSKGHVVITVHEINISTNELNSSQSLKSDDTCVNLQFCEMLSDSKLAMVSDKPILPENFVRTTAYKFEQSPTSIKVEFNVSENSVISFNEEAQELCSEIITGELYTAVKNFKIEDDRFFIAEKVER